MSKKQLETLSGISNTVKLHQDRFNKLHLEIFGDPGSMFYGLKAPGKSKCISMIGEEYDLCPDLIDMIKDIMIKKYREEMLKNYNTIYPCKIENKGGMGDSMNHVIMTPSWGVFDRNYCWTPRCIDYETGRFMRLTLKLGKYSKHGRHLRNHCIQYEGGIKLGDLDRYLNYRWKTSKNLYGRNGCVHSNFILSKKLNNGNQASYSDCKYVCPKKVLIEICESCTDKPIKKNYTKKDLYDHLMKYA